jgi:hypothetical protein
MKRLFIRIFCLIFVGLLGILLYANLLSMHQLYPITTAMINNASDAATRQSLIQDREKRNGRERTYKMTNGLILAADVALFVWLASGFFRRTTRRIQPMA